MKSVRKLNAPASGEEAKARREALERASRGIWAAMRALKPWPWHRANVAQLADVLADVERELRWMDHQAAREEARLP